MAHRYGTFVCKYCCKTITKTASRQFTCDAVECRRARARECAKRYLVERRKKTASTCEWCDEPLPRRLRKYHPNCRVEKDRARMRIYYWKQAAIRLGDSEAKRRRRASQRRKRA